MATTEDLKNRLTKRLKNQADVDLTGWVEASVEHHGYDSAEDVPETHEELVVIQAHIIALRDLATREAGNFSFKTERKSVDKSMISSAYLDIVKDVKKEYRRKAAEVKSGGTGARRADGR